MKKHILSLFILLYVFCSADAQFGPPSSTWKVSMQTIPSAGGTVTFLQNSMPDMINIHGSNLTLSGSVTYTYSGLPSNGANWYVYTNLDSVTPGVNNIVVFGQALTGAQYGGSGNYTTLYHFWVDSLGLHNTYQRTPLDTTSFNYTPTFPKGLSTDSINLTNASIICDSCNVQSVGRLAGGGLVVGCNACDSLYNLNKKFWALKGNSGTNSGSNFVGTTDTVPLEFRVNNQQSGKIEGTGNLSTAFGYQALNSETFNIATFHGNSAFGYQALKGVTGFANNTGFGYQAGYNITTGSGNTAVGYGSMPIVTTGSFNTVIGYGANVATNITQYGTAIGYNASAPNNTVGFCPNARMIYFPGAASGVNYVWTDTSGNGTFVPKPIGSTNGTIFTPVTGDSITITTNKNTINPAGTLPNLTLIVPNATPYTTYNFTFRQAISSLHVSTRLSSGTVDTYIPTSISAGQVFGMYFDPTLSRWVLEHN